MNGNFKKRRNVMQLCNICITKPLKELLNFGEQPVSHRLAQPGQEDYFHPLKFSQCMSCGILQLTTPFPVSEIIPHYDWIVCNEPESHLDELVGYVAQLPGIEKHSKIAGISFKEDSTLVRFNRLGFENTWRIDPAIDLGVKNKLVGIESVQSAFTVEKACCVREKRGSVDVLFVRHIVEHAYNTKEFVEACKTLLSDNAYIIFEVPDSSSSFKYLDYTTLWEEHILYFTEISFRHFFHIMDLSLVHFRKIKHMHEDVYVGIAHIGASGEQSLSMRLLEKEKRSVKYFCDNYAHAKAWLKTHLSSLREDKGPIAIYGAGHRTCTFINFMDLEEHIDCVIDDNPNMHDLYMPGSHLPIYPSEKMEALGIRVALLTVSEPSEVKIIEKSKLLPHKVDFYSIYPASKFRMEMGEAYESN